jgi:agmatinase
VATSAPPDPQRTLRLHPVLAVVPGTAPRLWHTQSTRVSRLEPGELGTLLAAFVRPRAVGEAVEELQRAGVIDDGRRGSDLVRRCVDAGWLVDAAAPGGAADEQAGGDTLFGAPRASPAEALIERPHVAAVGVPYEAGTTCRPGTRFGPQALRHASGTCFSYAERAGRPVGAWDPVAGARLLQGVTVADLGDVAEVAPVRNGVVLDRLRQTVAHLAGQGCLPLVLGGDHSIALAVIAGQARARGSVGVLHVDAHADRAGHAIRDWRAHAHHANFLTWALADERVARVVQLGVRQREPDAPPAEAKLAVWPGTTATAASLEAVLADLPDDVAWHITFDVDALDPSVLGATGTPVPGGFDAASLADLLAGIATRRRVAGIDVCELAPDLGDEADAMTAAEVVVRLLAAATTLGDAAGPGSSDSGSTGASSR